MRSRLLALPVLVAIVTAAVLWAPHDVDGLRDVVAKAGVWAPLLLLAVWLVGTPLLIPGTVLCAVGGLLLGPLGIGVSLLGSPLGALVAFAVSRWLGRPVVEPRLPARVRAAADKLERGGFKAVVVLRMAPGMPVGLFNHACGLSRLHPRPFVLGSAVGAAPRLVLYGALGGAMAQAGPLVLALGAAVALAAGGVLLIRRFSALPA